MTAGSAIFETNPDLDQRVSRADTVVSEPPKRISKPSKIFSTISDTRQHRFVSTTRNISAGEQSKIASASGKRRFLLIQNRGANEAILGFGSRSQDIQVPSGGVISFENGVVPANEVYAYSAAGTTLGILEGSTL